VEDTRTRPNVGMKLEYKGSETFGSGLGSPNAASTGEVKIRGPRMESRKCVGREGTENKSKRSHLSAHAAPHQLKECNRQGKKMR